MVLVIGSFAFTLALMFVCAAFTGVPLFYWLCFWAFFWVGLVMLCQAFNYYEQKYWKQYFDEYIQERE